MASRSVICRAAQAPASQALATAPRHRVPHSHARRGDACPHAALARPQDNTTRVPPPSQSEDTDEERPLQLPTPAERAIRLGPVAHAPPEFGYDEFTDGGRPAHAWAEGIAGMMEAGAVNLSLPAPKTQYLRPYLSRSVYKAGSLCLHCFHTHPH